MKAFGTYAYVRQDRTWELECEPHIVLKLKRVFPRVSRRVHGTIRMADTIEVARDLQWFIERFPLSPRDEASSARLAGQADKHREETSLVEQLLAGIQEPQAFDLAIAPRDYQRLAGHMTLAKGGLLLADDVGVGKTCSGICVISDPRARPALVVTLTHLPRQWQAELKRFAPSLTTHVLRTRQPYDLRRQLSRAVRGQAQLPAVMPMPDVIIASYSKLDGWAETLAPVVRSVVFDEAQELRREGSNRYEAARHIADRCSVRMGLTATPIYNYGDEMFNVLDVLLPGALGTRAEFVEEWCTAPDRLGRARIQDPAAFGTYARSAGLMLRRTRADVGRELPALSRIPHQVDSDIRRLEEIESSAAELAWVILRQGAASRGESFRAAGKLDGLVRQATGIAKAPYVADFVRLLVESGEKVVLYGWHREVYSIWLDRLKDLRPALFTGSESQAQKRLALERFSGKTVGPRAERQEQLDDAVANEAGRGPTDLLVISLRAGAGIDGLQKYSRTVVFGELDWSPGVHEQNIGRIYRDGQEHPVVAYFLLADQGSDPIVADVLGLKAAQAAGIRDPAAPLVEQLQLDGDHIKRLAQAYLAKQAKKRGGRRELAGAEA